ncbi:helix-turn-helix domain-containing protein [Patescibacteria group bacterium]
MKVKVTWNYSKDTEADRLIQAASNTFNRFYLKNDFLVLPYPYLNGNSSSMVYLPDLDLQKHPSFIKKVKKINPTTIPVTDDQSLIKTADSLIEKGLINFDEVKIKKLKNVWTKKEKLFFKFIEQTFPQLKNQVINLEIRPTNFGTNCSFNSSKTKGKNIKIIIYLRMDQSVAHIAEAVLSSLFFGWITEENRRWIENWHENEAVIDFLMTRTHIKDIFPKYKPTLKILRQKQLANLAQESQEYLNKLGIVAGDIFTLEKDKVLVDRKYTLTGLTEKEYRLLKFLIENKNQVCPVDTIGDILWQDDEDAFSLWAIAKQVERLRSKFQKHGLSPALIQAQRGQGYLLRD